MSLTTPDEIRTLQRKHYLEAKVVPEARASSTTPDFRFHQLYDKVWRADIRAHAYALARSNAGARHARGVLRHDVWTG